MTGINLPFILILSLLVSSKKGGALQVPCNLAPEHGSVRINEEGVYAFSCDDATVHELMGRQTARCLPDGYLDIPSLPKCVVKQPLTTHIKTTHNELECTNAAVETRHDLFMKYFSRAQCITEKTCIFKEMKYDCPLPDKVTIEQVFVSLTRTAGEELRLLASAMSEARHSRRKRFEDADSETDTSSCETGQGLSNNGQSCVNCMAGTYSNGDKTAPKCLECEVGTYSSSDRQTECQACTDKMSTLNKGSTSVEDCKILCTLPATSINSQYTVSEVAKEDGTKVEVNTKFTLLCNQGYTFKNKNTFEETCRSDLKTENIKNECFKVTAEPSSGVYKWDGEKATITCVGASSVNPHLVKVREPLPSGISVELEKGTDSYDSETKIEMPKFSVTNSAPGRFALSCDMQVYSDITEMEKSTKPTSVVFMKALNPPASVEKKVGDPVSITVMVYNDVSSTYDFSWTKGGKIYKTFQNSETTKSEVNYKKSEVSLDKATIDDSGKYECTVKIVDLEGKERLTKKFESTLTVREPGKCEAGKYEEEGKCVQCKENTYSAAGDTKCTQCDKGKVSPAGSTSEKDCKPAEYESDGTTATISTLLFSILIVALVV